MQRGLIRGLHYGVLVTPTSHFFWEAPPEHTTLPNLLQLTAVPLDEPSVSTCMPEAWTRASMVVRLNSLTIGASGVRPDLLKSLVQLLNKDVIPMVPLRGSISASGDLSPLSYIGGLMQGKPALRAYIGSRSQGLRHVIRADEALIEAGIDPIDVGPKEGLAIVNGTAPSTAVAALALHEAHCLTFLSQILTSMSVEALCGSDESFNSFFAEIRAHRGQHEAAKNILAFLSHSKLTVHTTGLEGTLRQDRYSIRTAAQWIGPVLEDLILAHEQVVTEINSATDNPLIDTHGQMLHGGNFQAKVITSAMEKTRQACQTIGQILFAQCTEMINNTTNRGLSPNLAVDEPSDSYLFKGTDICIAALQSELGFLASPVGSHVQFAEMGNQSLNSLALISGRYTLTAVDVLTQLSAAHLVSLCQALDLRALDARFLHALAPEYRRISQECLIPVLQTDHNIETLIDVLWNGFTSYLSKHTSMNSSDRITAALENLESTIRRSTKSSVETLSMLTTWTISCSQSANRIFNDTRADYLKHPDATPVLATASCRLYKYVREELAVPFFGEEYVRSAEWEVPRQGDDGPARDGRKSFKYGTIGEMITAVYQSMRSGALYAVTAEILRESIAEVKII